MMGGIDVVDEAGVDIDDRDCEGATLICIDVVHMGGQRVPCALCVQDHTNDVRFRAGFCCFSTTFVFHPSGAIFLHFPCIPLFV